MGARESSEGGWKIGGYAFIANNNKKRPFSCGAFFLKRYFGYLKKKSITTPAIDLTLLALACKPSLAHINHSSP